MGAGTEPLILGVSETGGYSVSAWKYGQAAIVVGQIKRTCETQSCDPSVPQDVQA